MSNLFLLDIDDTLLIIKNFISDNLFVFVIFIGFILFSFFVALIVPKRKVVKYQTDKKTDPNLINQDKLGNKENFENLCFELLKKLKIAKMNYDIETIKSMCIPEIANLYETQINTLKNYKQKNMIQNINFDKCYITNSSNENLINLRMTIDNYDFVVDENNKVIKGKYNKKLLQTYELEIKKDSSTNNIIINKIELLYEREI